MNPANKSLQRTYFIGGPPRIGKSLLAYRLAEKINGHVVSTDAVRNAAKKACKDQESDLFVVNKHENQATQDWLTQHLNQPKEVIEVQNKESRAVWPSLVSFCNSFVEDDAVHIVEGAAILPELVSAMKDKPAHVLFIGNTSKDHERALIDHAKNYPERDWMAAMGYSREKIEAMAHFIREMSQYFKEEAKKYRFLYFELSDDNFESSLDTVISKLMQTQLEV